MDWLEHRIPVGDHELRYVEAGDGEAMLWLHAGAGIYITHGTDLLADRFHVVGVEMPGFGSSTALDPGESLDDLSERVFEAVEAIGLDEHVLHGSSFGGAVALHLALNHPERIRRLVLESPSAFRPIGWTPPDLETMRRGLFRHPERARPAAATDAQLARAQRELVNRLSLAVDRESLANRLGSLELPTLVIFGDGDVLTPAELSRHYVENAPNCASLFIADAGHVVSSDQPEAYARAVGDFAAADN